MNSFWVSTLEQSFIFGIMVLGVYITYKVLDFPDLSVDGSFPLGASITALCLTRGIDPFLASFLALIGGALGGAITGFIHVKLKISNLLSGILVMTGLYSINLRIMGKANIPLFNEKTVFSNGIPPIFVVLIAALLVKVILDLFLDTKAGFVLKATGDNPQLITSLGIDTGKMKIMGLMISNGFVAFSGSILSQYQKFSDVGMGTGMVVMGLASIIIGESLFKRVSFIKGTTFALIGAILYRICVSLVLRIGLPPTDLKLITAIMVVVFLGLNNKAVGFKLDRKRTLPVRGEANA